MATIERMGLDTVTSPCSNCFARLKMAEIEGIKDQPALDNVAELTDYRYQGKVKVQHFVDTILDHASQELSRVLTHSEICMSRITFLKPVLLCILCSTQSVTILAADEPQRNLVGYSSELSMRPGDTVDFMVSTLNGGAYEADLVRVVNGDSQSRYKEMFEVVEVNAPFAGRYDGGVQALNLGSYVHVENASALDDLDSFTVAAWIFPTFDPTEYTAPDLDNIDPFSPPSLNIAESITHQTIVSRYDLVSGTGWALQIDDEYRLRFVAGNKSIAMDAQVKDWDWAYVAAAYDRWETLKPWRQLWWSHP